MKKNSSILLQSPLNIFMFIYVQHLYVITLQALLGRLLILTLFSDFSEFFFLFLYLECISLSHDFTSLCIYF